jgi:hypothetical protein
MKKLFSFCVALIALLVFAGCGGGGSDGDSKSSLANALNNEFKDMNAGSYKTVVYDKIVDKISENAALDYHEDKKNNGNYICSGNIYNVLECYKNNPFPNIFRVATYIVDSNKIISKDNGYMIEATYATTHEDDIFDNILNIGRELTYSVEYCVADGYLYNSNHYDTYIENKNNYSLNVNDGFYYKYTDDYVYAFGYSAKSIFIGVASKTYDDEYGDIEISIECPQ